MSGGSGSGPGTEAAARPTERTEPFDPVMRSPVHRRHAELGARFEREGPWETPAAYGGVEEERRIMGASVGLADITARGKVDVRGAIGPVVERLSPSDRCPGPGAAADLPGLEGTVLARIARPWALVLCPAVAVEGRLAQVEATLDDASVMVTDVSCLYVGFAVAGPRTLDFLRRLTPLDVGRLEPGLCAATRLAEVPAVLLRRELPGEPAEIYIGSEFGRYAWETLLETARRLGGGPVGWEALRAEGWW